MAETTDAMLDRAATAREIGTLVALALMKADGDPAEALIVLDDIAGVAPPEEDGELDAVPIAAQAIREACGLTGREVA